MPRPRIARFAKSNLVSILTLVFVAACPAVSLGQGSAIVSKVEPPNWWTNYSSPLMVLLYGENLNASNITTDYAGVTIDKVQSETDGKHAFVWLNIDANAAPGTVVMRVRNAKGDTTANLQLSPRTP